MRITRYIALIGKINTMFPLLNAGLGLTEEEKDIVRNAITEYQFYHGHERVEAPTASGIDALKESAAGEARKREKLSLKTSR
jgi:hypothetical protein